MFPVVIKKLENKHVPWLRIMVFPQMNGAGVCHYRFGLLEITWGPHVRILPARKLIWGMIKKVKSFERLPTHMHTSID